MLYVACIVGANALLTYVGTIPVGFGLLAPAGVLLAGFTFTARDLVQTAAGWRESRRLIPLSIVVGAGISALMSSRFAIASGATFIVSESVDWLLFSLVIRRGFAWALPISSVVAEVVDSVVFLSLAFGSLDFLPGQLVGKTWAMLVSVLGLWPLRTKLTKIALREDEEEIIFRF
jgi:uncharacterized PurR-regulated membrane protein YhhQ (DUF165 family)